MKNNQQKQKKEKVNLLITRIIEKNDWKQLNYEHFGNKKIQLIEKQEKEDRNLIEMIKRDTG